MKWLKLRPVITYTLYYEVYVDGERVPDAILLNDYEVVDVTAPSDIHTHRPIGKVRVDLRRSY